jgi:hypothetical protein
MLIGQPYEQRKAASVAAIRKLMAAGQAGEMVRTLEADAGVRFNRGHGFDPLLAMDAPQYELATVPSASIPYFLANWFDPKTIATLLSPMMAAVIVGEAQKGDWLTATAMFGTIEAVGDTASYDDYGMGGASNVNVNFPQRENFLFQAFLQYGEREIGRMGLAKIDWAAKQHEANVLVLMKALNAMYFYGQANLVNYGLLNDPALLPPLTATYPWLTSASATANTIYQDIVRLYIQLQAQSAGVIRMDSPMVLAMSPQQSAVLTEVTQYNTNSVKALVEQNFPNLRLETAVEYGPPLNTSGQLVQLICEEIEGQRTAECAFSVKLMAHNMVVDTSSWRQKRTSGGFGTVLYRPYAISQMLA